MDNVWDGRESTTVVQPGFGKRQTLRLNAVRSGNPPEVMRVAPNGVRWCCANRNEKERRK